MESSLFHIYNLDLPLQYEVTDTVHRATSETPHHPSRPPNFVQPWRIEHPSRHHMVLERFSVSPEAARFSSMGNKNDSDKTPTSLGNTSASSSKDDLVRVTDRREESQSEDVRTFISDSLMRQSP